MTERIWWSWCLWIRCIFFDNEGDKWPQGRIGREVAEEGFKEGLERGWLCVDEGLRRFLLSFLWGCEGILLCVVEDYVCPSHCFVGQQLFREFLLFLLSIYPVGIFVLNVVVIHIIQCDQATTAAVTFSWHLVLCGSCVHRCAFLCSGQGEKNKKLEAKEATVDEVTGPKMRLGMRNSSFVRQKELAHQRWVNCYEFVIFSFFLFFISSNPDLSQMVFFDALLERSFPFVLLITLSTRG